MRNSDNSIGSILMALRAKANLTQYAAGDKLGISHAYINLVENDKRMPTAVILRKMRDLYQIPDPDWVFIVYSIDHYLNGKFWGKK